MKADADAVAFAREIPKAELHVHLEGTITPAAYRRIAERNGMDAGDVETLFACDDFGSFLTAFLTVVRVLRTPNDFAELAGEYIAQLAAQNVRHVEFFLSPATQRIFVPDLDLEAMVRTVGSTCKAAAASHGMSASILFDLVRNLGPDEAMRDIDLALRVREAGVVGIGLGGDERNFPARDFVAPFERARAAGLRRTVHAGEAAGAESIDDAVRLLGAERIGHGVAASGNASLLALLRDRRVAIDACPTSNAVTGAVPRGRQHPLKEFLAAGIIVTLNSDDPAFFGASVDDEYANAARAGFTREAIAAIARNSFSASFLPEAEKLRLIREVEDYCAGGITR